MGRYYSGDIEGKFWFGQRIIKLIKNKMGRYYSGDIEGKFWFGVQSSDDAGFFGGEQSEPDHITYNFIQDDLDKVEEGIAKCKKELGTNKARLDKFFKTAKTYNDEKIAKSLKIDIKKVEYLLMWYARLELGQKIKDCLDKQEECCFDAEL